MRKINLVLAFLMLAIGVMAQEKKTITLEDVIPGGTHFMELQPRNDRYTWWGDGTLLHLNKNTVESCPFNKTNKMKTLITIDEVNDLLKEKNLKEINSMQYVSAPYADQPLLLVSNGDNRILVNWVKKNISWNQPIAQGAQNEDWSMESRNLAFTIANNLYVTTADGKQQQVTNEPNGIVCGQSVHRNEFGIVKGTFWSPKGNLLAFYRMDESMVTDYPQVNTSSRIATLEPDKYPMAGMTSHKVQVGIYNPQTEKTVWMQTADPTDRYFTNISWGPDEKSLYIIELNRDQNHAELIRYNAETGAKEATLLTEDHPKYVEPQHPLTFLPWDSSKFIYQSQKDGFNHLYLYDVQGNELKQLTQGEFVVQDILGFNLSKKEVIISSTEVSPLQTNIYGVNVKNGSRHLIGERDATHRVMLSSNGSNLIDTYSSHLIPRIISIVPTSGKGVENKLLVAEDPMKEYDMPEITVGTIKAADGKTDLYYRLTKPTHFDPNKKYPAVIYVYGGPHAQLIHNNRNYDARGWELYMASRGYVMFVLDSRGSDNRGLDFENCTFRHLGVEEGKDQMKGVEFLKSLPYVDGDRLGVHGWSFGGFMTINLMTAYPDVFKVGVSGGPVIDWKYYEVMYGERYMDTPQANPEGYNGSNLTLRAGKLKGRLNVIIGGNDPTCVPQHTFSFLRACIDAGVHPDLFIYPGQGHNMAGRDRIHLDHHITRYFDDFLK